MSTGTNKLRRGVRPGTLIQASDLSYLVNGNGSYVRRERKPWRTKAQAKLYKRARRQAREEAA